MGKRICLKFKKFLLFLRNNYLNYDSKINFFNKFSEKVLWIWVFCSNSDFQKSAMNLGCMNLDFHCTQFMNLFRNNRRKRRRNSLASSMPLSSSQIYETRATRGFLRGEYAVLRQVLLLYVWQGCFRVQLMGCFSSATL